MQAGEEHQSGQVRRILEDFFKGDTRPYGYILSAACDFSKKTRDTAVSNLQHGVQEFLLWGKGELEDLLIQPKNDNLLFAHFGISLQVRRRSKLTLKQKLVKEFGGLQDALQARPDSRPARRGLSVHQVCAGVH